MSHATMYPRLLFWRRWFASASLTAAAFGFALALLNQTSAFEPLLSAHVDPAFWGNTQKTPASAHFQQFAYGVMGAMLCGWGLLMASVARAAFGPTDRLVRRALSLSLLVWYFLDTMISLAFGVIWNAALNTVLLFVIGLPLVAAGRLSARAEDT